MDCFLLISFFFCHLKPAISIQTRVWTPLLQLAAVASRWPLLQLRRAHQRLRPVQVRPAGDREAAPPSTAISII
jgi:hypothetical protein